MNFFKHLSETVKNRGVITDNVNEVEKKRISTPFRCYSNILRIFNFENILLPILFSLSRELLGFTYCQ